MSEEPQAAFPAQGAMYHPIGGGIMWRGEAYYPTDYVMSAPVTDAEVEAAAEVLAEVTGEPHAGRFERTMGAAVLEAARKARMRCRS